MSLSNLFTHDNGACSRTELNGDRSLSYFLNPWKPKCYWLSRTEKGGWEDRYFKLGPDLIGGT